MNVPMQDKDGGKGGDLTPPFLEPSEGLVRSPVRTADLSRFDIARFWSRVEVRKADQCWPWRWGQNDAGYGEFRLGTLAHPAHRIAFLLGGGAVQEGLIVRHSCDNPICCNWAHLEVGTHQDNVRDRVERERSAIGRQNGRAVLTDDEVLEIRRSPLSDMTMARYFKVDRSTIGAIRAGKTWRHLLAASASENL